MATTKSAPTIEKFGLQTGTERTIFATWKWSKSHTKEYKCSWYYATGDGVWFVGADTTETVKQSLGQEMVLRAIAETEGVEISDEKFQEKASKYAAQMGSTDVDAFISQYGKSTIMASILQDEAVEILEKNAVVKNADGTLAETTAETETETASK